MVCSRDREWAATLKLRGVLPRKQCGVEAEQKEEEEEEVLCLYGRQCVCRCAYDGDRGRVAVTRCPEATARVPSRLKRHWVEPPIRVDVVSAAGHAAACGKEREEIH
eukprot:1403031-Rhodomonas_salina.1